MLTASRRLVALREAMPRHGIKITQPLGTRISIKHLLTTRTLPNFITMAAAHPTYPAQNSEFGYDFGHIPLDMETHVPLDTAAHVPLDTEKIPSSLYHSSDSADIDAFNAAWDAMMNTISAAPVLPSLDTTDTRKGSAATVQKFYEGRPNCKCCINWVEKQPEKVPDEAQQKYDGVAIRIYNGKNHNKETLGGLKTVSPTNIAIQSPVILKVLDPIFEEIGGPRTMNGSLSLVAPFAELFFAYPKILDAYTRS